MILAPIILYVHTTFLILLLWKDYSKKNLTKWNLDNEKELYIKMWPIPMNLTRHQKAQKNTRAWSSEEQSKRNIKKTHALLKIIKQRMDIKYYCPTQCKAYGVGGYTPIQFTLFLNLLKSSVSLTVPPPRLCVVQHTLAVSMQLC